MAEVNRQVDLVVLGDVKDVLLVLHVHSHKLVANLWCMLGVVNQTKLLGLDIDFQLWIILKSDAFTLDLLAPAVFVEAFSEEDDVGEHNPVVELVDPIAHSVQIESKDFVH